MVNINWNNVTGASSNAGTAALETAGNLFNKALNKFSGIATDAQKRSDEQYDEQFAANTEAALNKIRQVKTKEDLVAFDASQFTPDVLGKVDQSKINTAIDALQGDITKKERSDVAYEQAQDTYQFNIDERNREEAKRIAQENIDKGLRSIRSGDVEAKAINTEIRNQLSSPKYSGYVTFSEGVPSIDPNTPPELLNEMKQIVSGFKTRSTEQQDRNAVAALYKQYGGTLPEETQSISALKNARKEYNALPEVAQKELDEATAKLTTEATNTLAVQQTIYDQVVRDNPTDAILTPNGDDLEYTKIRELVKKDWPGDSWIGAGGKNLLNIINDVEKYGITSTGKVDSTNKNLDPALVYKPTATQIMRALGFNGQTEEDAKFFSDPTVDVNGFYELLGKLASNPENNIRQKRKDDAKILRDKTINSINSDLISNTKKAKANINTKYNIINKELFNASLGKFDSIITKFINKDNSLSPKAKKVVKKAINNLKGNDTLQNRKTVQEGINKLKSIDTTIGTVNYGKIYSDLFGSIKDSLTPKKPTNFKPRTRN